VIGNDAVMANVPDFSKLLSSLCHQIALSQEQKVSAVIDNLVLTVFVADPSLTTSAARNVGEAINRIFGFDFRVADIQSSLDRQIPLGAIVKEAGTGNFRLSPHTKAAIEIRLNEAKELEDRVREEWLRTTDYENQPRSPQSDIELWDCLKAYMTRAFKRHGVQTTMLLDPKYARFAEFEKTLLGYLLEAYEETIKILTKEVVTAAVTRFFRDTKPDRSKYIAQLMDGAFSFFAVAVDEATAAYLKKSIPPITIFLDTNFLFGILKLHDNPLNDVSQELVDAIRKFDFPFKLVYHEATLAEFKQAMRRVKARLSGVEWSPALSRAAVRSRRFTRIETSFHELNAKHQTDAAVFFSKFEFAEELLAEHLFTIYRLPHQSPVALETLDAERIQLSGEYEDYLTSHFGPESKSARTINHDVQVWQAVKTLRRKGTHGLDVGAIFLTADSHFYTFDWKYLRHDQALGHVILPNQFLQLLRPFIPVTDDFDRRFAKTFAIPEFRTGAFDYTVASSKVLQFLATYAEITEETAVRILANTILLQRLKNTDLHSPAFRELIESELTKDNQELLDENKRLQEALSATESSAQQNAETVAEKTALLATHSQLIKEQTELTTRQAAELEKRARQQTDVEQALIVAAERSERDIAELEKQRDTARNTIRIVVGSIVLLVGTAAAAYLRWFASFGWLQSHHHRGGICLIAWVLMCAITWMIVDKKRRKVATFVSLVIGALLVLAQIID
jgi:hypothetical protein